MPKTAAAQTGREKLLIVTSHPDDGYPLAAVTYRLVRECGWTTDYLRRFLADALGREKYDAVFTLLRTAQTHGHHRAATLRAPDAVSHIAGQRPLIFGAEPRGNDEATPKFSGLPDEPLTRTLRATPVLVFDREAAFGYHDLLNCQIVVNWLLAEHKSQGLFQKDFGDHRFEQFWLFAAAGETASQHLSQLQTMLDPLNRQTTAQKGTKKMNASRVIAAALWIGIAMASNATAAPSDSISGRWDATVTIRGAGIPFRIDFAGEGKDFTASLFNGEVPITPTSAKFENGGITLTFDQLPMTITAVAKDGQLDGRIEGRAADRGGSPFHAKRYSPAVVTAGSTAPEIAGVWEIAHETVKGEKAWRFIVRQSGPDIAAAILRVDGDTGSLTGRWQDGKFLLSHFDGTRPALMEITPAADGSLIIEQKTGREGKLIAYRVEQARARGVPEPADFATHTSVKDPEQPFTFRFPDANGKVWSNEDPKFKGKVLVVNITGTWCPNCHDEAPYLEQLYKKYHDHGLEIVALDFEEPEQQAELSRARAFVKKYGIEYTYLIAGAPAELQDKVTQLVNLNTWPATIFVGRDGRVKATHSGFAGPASGDFFRQLDQEYTSTIERLLSEQSDQASAPVRRPRE